MSERENGTSAFPTGSWPVHLGRLAGHVLADAGPPRRGIIVLMTSTGSSRDLVGGATLPGSIGLVSATYPFAVLHATTAGIEVVVRPPWLASFFGAKQWSRCYSEIQKVYASRRGVALLVTRQRLQVHLYATSASSAVAAAADCSGPNRRASQIPHAAVARAVGGNSGHARCAHSAGYGASSTSAPRRSRAVLASAWASLNGIVWCPPLAAVVVVASVPVDWRKGVVPFGGEPGSGSPTRHSALMTALS